MGTFEGAARKIYPGEIDFLKPAFRLIRTAETQVFHIALDKRRTGQPLR